MYAMHSTKPVAGVHLVSMCNEPSHALATMYSTNSSSPTAGAASPGMSSTSSVLFISRLGLHGLHTCTQQGLYVGVASGGAALGSARTKLCSCCRGSGMLGWRAGLLLANTGSPSACLRDHRTLPEARQGHDGTVQQIGELLGV